MNTKPLWIILATAVCSALLLSFVPAGNGADLDVRVGAKFNYQYFPDAQVYFDSSRGLYFYMKGTNWQTSVSLPGDIKVDRENYVVIEDDTDRPYIKHKSHKKRYPPGLAKKGWKRGKKHHKKKGKRGKKW